LFFKTKIPGLFSVSDLETYYIIASSLYIYILILYMSSSDYISLKKTKILKNYHVNTNSTTNIPQVSYENYLHNLSLKAANCSTSTYGNGVAKPLTLNNIKIGSVTTCPANTFEGPIRVPTIHSETPRFSVRPKYTHKTCLNNPLFSDVFDFCSSKAPYHRQWNVKLSK